MAITLSDIFTELGNIFVGLETRGGAQIKNTIRLPSGIACICRSYMDIRCRVFRPNVSETLRAPGYHPERVKSPEGSAGRNSMLVVRVLPESALRHLHSCQPLSLSLSFLASLSLSLSPFVRSSHAHSASLSRSFFPYFAL